jgi:hypothetical protein
LFSQLFYYTNNGWRFNFNISYNLNIYKSYKYTILPGATNVGIAETSNKKLMSQSFQIGIGVKKDFAIPIPKRFRKTHYCNSNFKAFLDLNGNKKFDINEVPLENVVFRLNDYEVLSNDKGESSFLNIGLGKYKLQVLSLVDIGAWFPVVPDSLDITGANTIFVPFSQGVQILGNVHINREKFSEDIKQDLDISRLKIYLVDSLGKLTTSVTDSRGDFKFYVPYGKYTLKFDENVLGAGFELLQNDIPVELTDGIESYYHTFFIVEKKRKVVKKKFDANGNAIDANDNASKPKQFDSNGNVINDDKGAGNKKYDSNGKLIQGTDSLNKFNTKDSNSKMNQKNSKKSVAENPIDEKQLDFLIGILTGKIKPYKTLSKKQLSKIESTKIRKTDLSKFGDEPVYCVQLGAYTTGLPQNVLAVVLKLKLDLESYKDEKDGLTKYFTGNQKTYDAALKLTNEIKDRGIKGAFVIVIDKGSIKTNKEFNEQVKTQ